MGAGIERYLSTGKQSGDREFSIDDWLSRERGVDTRAVTAANAGPTQPERAQRILDAQRQTDLDHGILDRNLENIETRIWRTNNAERARAAGPAVKNWLAENPNHLAAASRDLTQLNFLERYITNIKDQWKTAIDQVRMQELAKKEMRGAITPRETEEFDYLSSRPTPQDSDYDLLGATLSAFPGASLGKYALGIAPAFANQLPVLLQSGGGAAKGAAAGGIGGAALAGLTLGPEAIPAGFSTGSRIGALVGGANAAREMEMYSAYADFRRLKDANGEVIPKDVARAAAFLYGIAAGSVEALELHQVTKFIPGLKSLRRDAMKTALKSPTFRGWLLTVAKDMAGTAAWEGGTEGVQQLMQNTAGLVAQMINDKSFSRFSAPELYQRLFEGVGESIKMGTQVAIATVGAGNVVASPREVRNIRQAAQARRFFEALGTTVKNTEMSTKLPHKLEEVVDRMTKDGPIENIYVSLPQWNELFQSQNIDPAEIAAEITGSPDSYEEALSTGELRIPTAKYAANIAPTELHGKLIDDLRLGSPLAMTNKETQAFIDEMNAKETAEPVPESDQTKAATAAFENLKTPLTEKLRAAAAHIKGVDEDYVQTQIQQLGRVFTNLASREGVSLDRLTQLFGALSIGNEVVGQGLDQNPASDSRFAEWFGESKVVDAQGKPLVVYHGTKSDFDVFDLSAAGSNNDTGMWGTGFYFSPNKRMSLGYGDKLKRVYLSLQNPLVLHANENWPDIVNGPYVPHTTHGEEGKKYSEAMRKKLVDAGYDGVIQYERHFTAGMVMPGEKMSQVVAFYPEQIKSAIGNRGTFDPNDPNIFHQSTRLRTGTETLIKYGLDPSKTYTNRHVAWALEARTREKHGIIDRNDRSKEARDKIAKWIVEEVLFELQTPEASGAGWYGEKFQRALDVMALQHPELAHNRDARELMTAIIAVTSNGVEASQNFKFALEIYADWKKTGAMRQRTGSDRGVQISKNLRTIEMMYYQLGASGMRDYLLELKTVGELAATARSAGLEFSPGYQAHVTMPRATIIFGAKLGAFYANLMGQQEYLTMDRWWSRTFNRYRGTLLRSASPSAIARVRDLLKEPKLTDEQVVDATIPIMLDYADKGFKNGTELEKAANTLYKDAHEKLEDAPFSPGDRTFMLETVARAQELLKKQGHVLSKADIQAILWYYEKKLYGKLTNKAGRGTAQISYEDAARATVFGGGDRSAGSTASGDTEEAGLGSEFPDDLDDDGSPSIYGDGSAAVAAGDAEFNVDAPYAEPPARSQRAAAEGMVKEAELAYGSLENAIKASEALALQAGDLAEDSHWMIGGYLPIAFFHERLDLVRKALTRKYVDIRGKKLTKPEHIYNALATFRDPTKEKFHVIIRSLDGTVVSHEMVTSGALNFVQFSERLVPDIIRRVDRLGPRAGLSVTIAHNHPSGNPSPSPDDGHMQNYIGWKLQDAGIRLDGQAVLDHNTMAWMTPGPNGLRVEHIDTKLSTKMAGPTIARDKNWTAGNMRRFGNPQEVMKFIHANAGANAIHIIYVDPQHQVIALEPRNNLKNLKTWLPQQMRAIGAIGVFIAGPDADVYHLRDVNEVPPGIIDVIGALDEHHFKSYAESGLLPMVFTPEKDQFARRLRELRVSEMSAEDLQEKVEVLNFELDYPFGDRDDLNSVLNTDPRDLTEADVAGLRDVWLELQDMKAKRDALRELGAIGENVVREYHQSRWAEVPRPSLTVRTVDEHVAILRAAGQSQEADNLEAFMRGSEVRTVVFHGTRSRDNFDTFDARGDLGIHCGTVGQANDRIDFMKGRPFDDGGQNYPVFISLKNPLRLPDVGSWKASDALEEALRETGLFTKEEIDALDFGEPGENPAEPIRAFLQSKGYDGIVYLNESEIGGAAALRAERDAAIDAWDSLVRPVGSQRGDFEEYHAMMDAVAKFDSYNQGNRELSYIVFSPNQIKSAIGNSGTFDGSSNSVLFQAAYHGSPHLFEKFDLRYIGSGEGSAAFGWGMYFAGKKEVAEFYRNQLTAERTRFTQDPDGIIPDFYRAEILRAASPIGHARTLLANQKRFQANREESLAKHLAKPDSQQDQILATAVRREIERDGPIIAALEKLVKSRDLSVLGERGRVYTVDIPDDDQMLLLDESIDKQNPIIQELVRGILKDLKYLRPEENGVRQLKSAFAAYRMAFAGMGQRADGSLVYSMVQRHLGPGSNSRASSEEWASRYLASLGVPGIRYADQLSRNKRSKKTFNYVIFDDKFVKILDMEQGQEHEEPHGRIRFSETGINIDLLKTANLSTFLHETGHFYTQILTELAATSPSVKQDLETLRAWAGADEGAELTREQHEKIARGFEYYLMEGEAPTPALIGTFARMKAWMLMTYKSIQSFARAYGINLTDEVRDVFDRLIASDAEIQQANKGLEPLFENPEELGMTEAKAAEYRKAHEAAQQSAHNYLEQKALAEVKRARTQAWQEARAKVRAEIAEQVNADPMWRALSILQRHKLPDGTDLPEDFPRIKLDRQALIDMYGGDEDVLKSLPRPYIYAKDGMNPQAAAELLGFPSAAELLKALPGAGSETAQARVERLTDERMKAEFGDLLSEGQIAEEAARAVHNVDRARLLRLELEHLASDRIGVAKQLIRRISKRIPSNDAVRAEAEKFIAMKRNRSIKPHEYLAGEKRSAKLARELLLDGDIAGAFREKLNELVNHERYRAAANAVEENDKIVRHLRRFQDDKLRARIGKVGGPYLDQIDQLLERFELAPISDKAFERRQSLIAFAQANPSVDIPEALLNEANRQNYGELTHQEFKDLRDTIVQIAHIARTKERLLKNFRFQSREDAAAAVAGEIVANAKKKLPASIETRLPAEERRRERGEWFTGHRKYASLWRQMAGYNDAAEAWETMVRPLNEAANEEAAENERAAIELDRIFGVYSAKEKRDMYEPRPVDNTSIVMSKMGRLMVALNWGNEINKKRLLDGYARKGYTEKTFQAVIDSLDERDWQFVQSVWDYLETYWPRLESLGQDLTGLKPEHVKPTAIQTRFGEVRGGYLPIVYDDRQSSLAYEKALEKQAERTKNAGAIRSTTEKGMLKERVEGNVRGEIKLDFNVIFSHVSDVIHTITHTAALKDVTSILSHEAVADAVRDHYGDEVYKTLIKTLDDVASGDIPAQNNLERRISWLRQGATIVGLGFSFTTSLLQPFGIANAVPRIGARWVGTGILSWIKNPLHTVETVHAKSTFMRLRHKTMMREINEIQNQLVTGGKVASWVDEALETVTKDKVTRQGIADSYFWMIGRAQMVADIPTWVGAYERALEENVDEATAIARADQAVLDTQGGGQVKDLAEFQRGSPLLKLFTNFYSYFNVVYNQLAESHGRTDYKDPASIGRLAADFLLIVSVPTVLQMLLRDAIGTGDDKDPWWERMLKEHLGVLLGTMILTRELSGFAQGYWNYSGPAGSRIFGSLGQLMRQAEQGELDANFFKALNQSAGILFHYPAAAVERFVRGAAALTEGETRNPLALLFGPPKKAK